MTTYDDVELRLREALEVSLPTAGGRVLDARVARAMVQSASARDLRGATSGSVGRAIALAAALALPTGLVAAGAFPVRETLIIVTVTVIVFTLLGQGLSLPWLIRRMGVGSRAALLVGSPSRSVTGTRSESNAIASPSATAWIGCVSASAWSTSLAFHAGLSITAAAPSLLMACTATPFRP